MTDRFKKTWRGWIHSSDGFAVRVGSRTGIDYRDDHGQIHIDSERMADPWSEVVVYTDSIPDIPHRTKAEVLERLAEVFEFAGWQMTLEDAWID